MLWWRYYQKRKLLEKQKKVKKMRQIGTGSSSASLPGSIETQRRLIWKRIPLPILDGRTLSKTIREELSEQVASLDGRWRKTTHLAAIPGWR